MTSKPALLLLLVLYVFPAQGFFGFDTVRTRAGHVMARGIVLSESGNPVFVEYNQLGEEAQSFGEEVGPYLNAWTMSAPRYRQIVENYRRVQSEGANSYARGATVMSRSEYEAATFTTRSGQAVTKPPLQSSSLSVFVRHRDQQLIADVSPILFEAPIDLSDAQDIEDAFNSLLISELGKVLRKAEGNIGYRVGFYENEEDDPRLNAWEHDRVYQGLSGVPISTYSGYIDGHAVTDSRGYFSSQFLLSPCPGFYYDYKINSFAQFRYRRYNPRGSRHGLFHLNQESYEACNGVGLYLLHSTSLVGIMAGISLINQNTTFFSGPTNFLLDTAILSGQGYVANPSPSGEQRVSVTNTGGTQWEFQQQQPDKITQSHFDFDDDGVDDVAVLGIMQPTVITDPATGAQRTVSRFQRVNNPTAAQQNDLVQGVYLSSGNRNPALPIQDALSQPDFTRLGDYEPHFEHQGLLSQISEEDLKDTDLFVFRESNGQLVTHRRGLRENEFRMRRDGGVDQGEIYYQFLIRGPKTKATTLDKDYSAFQSEAKMNPALHAREADHLRAQEPIRIIAINRKTGYIGSVKTNFMDFNIEGMISFPIEKLVLRPPQLKVRAEREYTVQAGMTRDEDREYLIGFEGAATTGDTTFTITTEWFDHDGSPLPEGLSEYGYTGRLAKVGGANTLITDGGQLAQFSIKPGRHLQTVRLRGQYTTSEHFYVQINPEPENQNPDFSTLGAATSGPLQYRPRVYVPFLVPIEDEDATIRQYNAYRALRRDQSIPRDQLVKPDPVFKWVYRPEMQFSLYDLTMRHVYRQASTTNATLIDLLPQAAPTVLTSDALLQIAYDLAQQQFSALPYLDTREELVFAFGEHELVAQMGQSQQLIFTNIEHFAALAPEDFVSIRLFRNNDPSNILWEYAFNVPRIKAAYKIPHQVTNFAADSDRNNRTAAENTACDPDTCQLFRVLGGMRIQLDFKPRPGEVLRTLTWDFGSSVRLCDNFDSSANCNSTNRVQLNQPTADQIKIYWEGGAANNTWVSTNEISGSVRAEYDSGENETQNFMLKSRELQPNATTPMKGTDVEMLEQLLWQIGRAPNNQSRLGGVRGVRIASGHRDVFSTGCIVTSAGCTGGTGSTMEMMVWRFQYQNEISTSTRNINNVTLQKLKKHWDEYYEGYSNYSTFPTLNGSHGSYANWLTNAIPNWNGIYTPQNVTLQNLLDALIAKESGDGQNLGSGRMWGVNGTGYRTVVGGYDSEGSIGFSQIKTKWVYGASNGVNSTSANRCRALANINLYEPEDAVEGVVQFTTGSNGNCGRSFRLALLGNYDVDYANNGNVRITEVMGDGAQNINGNLQADDFDAVSKAIMGYNAGASQPNGRSWPTLLKDFSGLPIVPNVTPEGDKLKKNGIGYSLRIKAIAGYALRDYRWQVTEAMNNGNLVYCFEFGESNWGQRWNDVKTAARTQQLGGVNTCP